VPDNAARSGIVGTTNVGVAPAVQPLLALWPLQNGPELGNGIAEAFSHPLQTVREDFGTTRADYNLSPKDTLFGVYTIDDSYANTPSANPLSSVLEGLREQVASMQEQHVFSPSILIRSASAIREAAITSLARPRSICRAGWPALP